MHAPSRVRFLSLLNRAREGFWLIPSLMALTAAAIGTGMPWLDAALADELRGRWQSVPLISDAKPEGARALLAAIAGSSITVAATVFSITIATLALTSQQFGPRLLRTFISDRGVQCSLGTFIATFLYPLLVLRVVRAGEDERAFVPHLSVTLAMLMAVAAVGVLIYFIDHVASMIRAPQIIHAVGRELDEVIDERIPADGRLGDTDEAADDVRSPAIPDPDAPAAATAGECGYITYVDEATLVRVAEKNGLVFRLAVHVGSYVHERGPLALFASGDQLDENDRRSVRHSFGIGPHRTIDQDVSHGINQLVELALRAISPGINDPFTAQTCVDRISASLSRIADRPFPDPRLRDGHGQVRVLLRRPTFACLVSIGFAPIRRYARSDVALLGRMLQGLRAVAQRVPPDRPDRLQALRVEAQAVARSARDLDELDRRLLEWELAQFNQINASSADVAACRGGTG